jgi:hypothetical protein
MLCEGHAFPIEGGCACRLVRYRMLSEPMVVHACHCHWCQRETGTAFALNAMIEADRVINLGAEPQIVDTPSNSGKGQKIARCPRCQIAVWSTYAGSGPHIRFVRIGTLDDAFALRPDVHIFTESKQPWVTIPPGDRQVPQYYKLETMWSADSLARRAALKPQIDAYRASLEEKRAL